MIRFKDITIVLLNVQNTGEMHLLFNRSQPCSYHYSPINSTTPQRVRIPSNYMNETPEKVNELCSLKHNQVVCAVSIGSNEQQRHLVYTGGKGCVKVSLCLLNLL